MFPFLKLAALEKTVDYKWPANTHAVVYKPRVKPPNHRLLQSSRSIREEGQTSHVKVIAPKGQRPTETPKGQSHSGDPSIFKYSLQRLHHFKYSCLMDSGLMDSEPSDFTTS